MKHDQTANALAETVPGLPASWYFDPLHHSDEMKRIWHRNWVYVCRSDSISEAGAYRTFTIGDQNIVVVRTDTAKLSAFYNTCRHRGSVLCPEQEGRLKSRLFVCPYHQWSYAADDGRLVNTTSFAEPKGFSKKDYPLFKVAVAQWRGCVFVNLDSAAVWSAQTAFQRAPDMLDRFPLESMVTGHSWRTEIRCNWKSFWENFNECLHCPNVHPELSDLVPLYSRRIINPRDVPDWHDHEDRPEPAYRGGLRAGAETWSSDGSAQGRVISTLSHEDISRGQTYASAWPSMFIGGYADHVRIVRLLPLGAESIELTAQWLFEADTLSDPAYDIDNVINFETLVMEQDGAACEINQRGLHSTPFEAGVLMPEEYLLKRFHEWVRAAMNC